jgi:hypothetical protein
VLPESEWFSLIGSHHLVEAVSIEKTSIKNRDICFSEGYDPTIQIDEGSTRIHGLILTGSDEVFE